jgi:hypothetical protein
MSSLVLTFKGADVSGLKKDSTLKVDGAQGIINHLAALQSGAKPGTVYVSSGSANPVAATASIAVTHANVTNADTTTICNTVITAATSGNGTTSWTIGADATADAVALAACINANSTLSQIVTASIAVAGTVTLTAKARGVVGNGLALATSDATAFGLTAFAGGTGGITDASATWAFGQ